MELTIIKAILKINKHFRGKEIHLYIYMIIYLNFTCETCIDTTCLCLPKIETNKIEHLNSVSIALCICNKKIKKKRTGDILQNMYLSFY